MVVVVVSAVAFAAAVGLLVQQQRWRQPTQSTLDSSTVLLTFGFLLAAKMCYLI